MRGSDSAQGPASSRAYQRIAIALALLYLLLPNAAFLCGWYSPWLALPVSLILLLTAGYVWYHAKPNADTYAKTDWICLILSIVGCLLWTEMISFHGHALQMSDFIARNQIFGMLVRDDWPLYNEDGKYFVYYLAWWLPAALVAKLTSGWLNPSTILFVWAWLGLSIGCAVAFIRLKRNILHFFIITTLLGSFADWVNFSGGDIWNDLGNSETVQNFRALNHYISRIRFFVWSVEISQTFNHAIPILVALALLCCKRIPWKYLPYTAALAVACSPIGCISLFALLLFRLLGKWQNPSEPLSLCKEWTVGSAVLLLVPVGLYFGTSSGNGISLTPFSTGSPLSAAWWSIMSCYALNIILLLIPAYFLLQRRIWRANSLYRTFVALVVLTPMVYIGTGPNELMYKAGAVFYPCMAWCYAIRFRHSTAQWKRVFLLILILASGATVYRLSWVVWTYTWNKDEMSFNCKIDPSPDVMSRSNSLYQRFITDDHYWSTNKPIPPLLTKRGESSEGLLSPFATHCTK